MSKPTLKDAIDAMNERKLALGMTSEDEAGLDLERDEASLLLVGFDLPLDDTDKFGQELGVNFVNALWLRTRGQLTSNDILGLASSAWFDGLITGLMLAELRGKARVS